MQRTVAEAAEVAHLSVARDGAQARKSSERDDEHGHADVRKKRMTLVCMADHGAEDKLQKYGADEEICKGLQEAIGGAGFACARAISGSDPCGAEHRCDDAEQCEGELAGDAMNKGECFGAARIGCQCEVGVVDCACIAGGVVVFCDVGGIIRACCIGDAHAAQDTLDADCDERDEGKCDIALACGALARIDISCAHEARDGVGEEQECSEAREHAKEAVCVFVVNASGHAREGEEDHVQAVGGWPVGDREACIVGGDEAANEQDGECG